MSAPLLAAAVVPPAAPTSPLIRANWTGLSASDNAWLVPADAAVAPPDVQVAAGPSHIVEMVNLAISIWTTQGTFVRNESLMSFFGVSSSEFISDPKVQYDAASGRWFASVTDVTPGKDVILAVSPGSGPTVAWTLYHFGSGECYDQPILGVGNQTVILSVNVFSSCTVNKPAYSGAQYWVISKADLLAGSTTPAFQTFGPYASTASIHPAQGIGPGLADYLVSADANLASVSSIELLRVTGTPPSATVTSSNLTVRTITPPPAAVQPGGALPLDPGDFRVQDAVWSSGNLWLSLGDSCTPAGDTQARSCVRLIQINTTSGTVAQDFDVGSAGQYYLYPALRMDGRGNLLVIFGYSSATDYPGLMAAGRVFGDPAGSLDPPEVVVRGTADESLACSSSTGTCRYGDYFGAALDPSNASVIWAAGEFGTPSGWGTRVFSASVKATLTLSYSIVNGGSGYETPTLSYTLDGMARSADLAPTPMPYAADPGTSWSVSSLLLNPGTVDNVGFETWQLNATSSAPHRGTVNASFAESFPYFHMYRFGFWYNISDNGTVVPPVIRVEAWNVGYWLPAGFPYYADAGSSFSYPSLLNGSSPQEQWTLGGPANGTVTGPGNFTGVYFHQYRVSFDYLLQGGSSSESPAVHYFSQGTNLSVQANATVWADARRPYTYTVVLSQGAAGVRVGAVSGTVGEVTGPETVTVTYGLQYLLTVAAAPEGLAGNVSGAGWYDAGSVATVSATAPTGWEFVGWSGAAAGSSPSATVTMTAPTSVTALFYPGLTIVAGGGGTVAYSYGTVSGTVPAGGTLTVYAPLGTAITLTAEPSSWTQTFASWGGDAQGSSQAVTFTLSSPASVSASFGTSLLAFAAVAAAIAAVLLAALVLILAARRRRKEPPV